MIKLLTMLGAGIPALVGGLIAFIGRKWGTVAATVAMFGVLTAAFIACINLLLGQLLTLLNPPAAIANALGMFFPSDFASVLSVIVSSKICRAAYDLAMDKARVYASAS
jgi:hypothetical protein